MTTTAARDTASRTPDPAALDRLAAAVPGPLFTPDHPDWDRVRAPWALAIDQRPAAVLEVGSAEEIQTAVRWAVEHGVPVTAQPVGHGAGDALEGVLVLRTGALDGIEIDAEARVVRIGAGVRAGDLLAALDGSGLTFLCGSNPSVSVVGMTLTGGLSWFGRAYGMAAHSIVGATVVDGFGRLLRLSPTEQPDLFWAIRGGGGDFGIVVSLDLALHPAPALYGGRLMWPVAQMPAVLEAFAAVTAVAPPELTVWYQTLQLPPSPDIPAPLRGRSFALVALTFLGAAADAEALIAPLRAVPDLAMDLLGPLTVGQLAAVAAEPVDPMPSLEHAFLLDDLSAETAAALVEITGAGSRSPLAVLQIRHLGGALAGAADAAADPIPAPYVLFAMGVPMGPEAAAAIAATFGRLDAALADHTSGRTPPNFLGPRGDLTRAYAPATLRRLAAVKRQHEPLSTIRSNRPVLAQDTNGKEI